MSGGLKFVAVVLHVYRGLYSQNAVGGVYLQWRRIRRATARGDGLPWPT